MSMAEVGLCARIMTEPKTEPVPLLSASDAANQALAGAIEFAQPYGRVKAIAEALTDMTGQSVTRQMVGRWLNPDPEKRVTIGNFGMGLALLFVVARLQDPKATTAEFTIEVPTRKTTRKTK